MKRDFEVIRNAISPHGMMTLTLGFLTIPVASVISGLVWLVSGLPVASAFLFTASPLYLVAVVSAPALADFVYGSDG